MRYLFLFVLLLVFSPASYSQVYKVSGKIIDADTHDPLSFVNILINDGHSGGTTDIDGKFSFRSAEEIKLLKLSYVGYETLLYPVGNKTEKIVIKLKKTEIQLPEYIVFPAENPAHRIIKNAVANRDKNDPEKLPAFSYTSYDKMIFTMKLDSLYIADTLKADNADMNLREYLDKYHVFIMETISERKFMYPDKNNEKVIATKIAGFKDPIFIFLLSQMQSSSFYSEIITIAINNYVNPISKGSTKKYFFLLQDTLYTGTNDTVFIISFRPQKNTNFDGLEGVISINTHNWAIQNVIAEPAISDGVFSLKIEQMYDLIDGIQWFPIQLNTKVVLKSLVFSDSSLKLNPGKIKDTINAKADNMLIGTGKSYIRDINLNPGLRKCDFTNFTVDVEPDASHRKPEYWLDYRLDSLTQKELNTYRFIDSISKKAHLERKAKTFESLLTGKIPWGYFDLDMNRFIKYNAYEGIALGLGMHTNERLSQIFSIGGFARYGFKDKTLKYGGDLSLMIHYNSELQLDIAYMDDVTETSGVTFFDENLRLLKPEYFRNLLIKRMDKTRMYSSSIGFRTLKYIKMNIGLIKSHKQVTNDYRYAVSDQDLRIYHNSFDFTEVRIGLKYAYGEKFIKNMRKKISFGTDYPILWFQYSRGIKGFLDGGFNYNRYDFKIVKSFYSKYLGETSVKLAAGYVDADIPYTNLYNGNGSYRAFTLFAPNSFATMRMNEFLSNKYIALYFTHDFGKLLCHGERFQPEFAFATNIGFGWLDFNNSHYNIDYKTMEKGYYESGILVNNLLNLQLYSLGIGIFYRYGPYTFPYALDNLGGKFTLTFGFKTPELQ